MKVWLSFRRGGLDGQRRELRLSAEKPVLLGRSPRCGLVFPDQDRTVSAAHAKLWFDAGALFVTDVGSRYGTYVNGKAIQKHRLACGDRIQFGANGPEAVVSFGEATLVEEEPTAGLNITSSIDRETAMTMFRDLPKMPAGKGSITDYLKSLQDSPLYKKKVEDAAEAQGYRTGAIPEPDVLAGIDGPPPAQPDVRGSTIHPGDEVWVRAIAPPPEEASEGEPSAVHEMPSMAGGEVEPGFLDEVPPEEESDEEPAAAIADSSDETEPEVADAPDAPEAAEPAEPPSVPAAWDPSAATQGVTGYSMQLPSLDELMKQMDAKRKKPR